MDLNTLRLKDHSGLPKISLLLYIFFILSHHPVSAESRSFLNEIVHVPFFTITFFHFVCNYFVWIIAKLVSQF